MRFARAFAIPKAAAKSVVEELNGLAETFKQVREAFLATYDEEIRRWKNQHPGYERLIEAEFLPKALVGSKFAFGYEVFAINAVHGDDELAALIKRVVPATSPWGSPARSTRTLLLKRESRPAIRDRTR